MNTTARPLPAFTKAEIERFWAKVNRGDADSCWNWTASLFQDGYGQHKVRGRNLKANRVAFWLARGIDVAGKFVLHTCDNRACCNPAHLFLGTGRDNILDCKAKGRLNTAAGPLHGSRTKPERWARGERVAGAVLTADAVSEIRHLYASGGITQQQIADRYGVSREAISSIIRCKNWKHVDAGNVDQMRDVAAENRVKRGTAHRSAKLTEDDVRAIRERFAQGGIGYSRLAAQYGVTPRSIKLIVHRHTWSHVT